MDILPNPVLKKPQDNRKVPQDDNDSILSERSLTNIVLKTFPTLTATELCSALEALPSHLQIRLLRDKYGERIHQPEENWTFRRDLDLWAALVSVNAQTTPKPAWFSRLCTRKHHLVEQLPGHPNCNSPFFRPLKSVCNFWSLIEEETLGGFDRLKWLQHPDFNFIVYLELQRSALFAASLYDISKIRHLQSLKLERTAIWSEVGADGLRHEEPLRDKDIRNMVRYGCESGGFSSLIILSFVQQPCLSLEVLDHCKLLPALQTVAVRDCRSIYPTRKFNISKAQGHPYFSLQCWWHSESSMLKKLFKGYDEWLKAQGDKTERQRCVLELQLCHSEEIARFSSINNLIRQPYEYEGRGLILLWWKKGVFSAPNTDQAEALPSTTKDKENEPKKGQLRAHLKRKAKDTAFQELENCVTPKRVIQSPPKQEASPPWIYEDNDDDHVEPLTRP